MKITLQWDISETFMNCETEAIFCWTYKEMFSVRDNEGKIFDFIKLDSFSCHFAQNRSLQKEMMVMLSDNKI